MTGFEPATSCSQSRRATSCATFRRNNSNTILQTEALVKNHSLAVFRLVKVMDWL